MENIANRRVPRLAPAAPPFAEAVQQRLDRLLPPGVAPLALFTTLARDTRLFERFVGAGLLDRGRLTLRQRELMIDRTTALCGSEYEWGVHVAFFGERAGLDAAQRRSLAHGSAADACWSDDDRLVLRLAEALHARADVDDALWDEGAARFAPEALVELLMLAGQYRMVSYLTNALRLAPEAWAARWG